MSTRSLNTVIARITHNLRRDELIQETTADLRTALQVDRVLLYYFYSQWKGQVTFESLSAEKFSIIGCTGADDCFNDQYAAMYEAGKFRAIPDIETEPIHPCHRNFLRSIQVRANLVVPILNRRGLWGLLAAHHCQDIWHWKPGEIMIMQTAAKTLGTAVSIRDN